MNEMELRKLRCCGLGGAAFSITMLAAYFSLILERKVTTDEAYKIVDALNAESRRASK